MINIRINGVLSNHKMMFSEKGIAYFEYEVDDSDTVVDSLSTEFLSSEDD